MLQVKMKELKGQLVDAGIRNNSRNSMQYESVSVYESVETRLPEQESH